MKIASILLALSALTSQLFATPHQVILIRHAEKPTSGDSLSQKGFERAAALVSFFTDRSADAPYNIPVAIYAQSVSKNHKSLRPVQTVTPLSNALGIKPITKFTYADIDALVNEVNNTSAYDNQTVLICWSHGKIDELAAKFGVTPTPSYPKGVYDRLWLIDFSSDGKVLHFKDQSQQLLFDDSGESASMESTLESILSFDYFP